jgi:hypothetical protein
MAVVDASTPGRVEQIFTPGKARPAGHRRAQLGRKPHGSCKNSQTVPRIQETVKLRYS